MGSNEGRVETERLKNSKLFKKNLKCLWQRRWSILNVGGDPYKKGGVAIRFPKVDILKSLKHEQKFHVTQLLDLMKLSHIITFERKYLI